MMYQQNTKIVAVRQLLEKGHVFVICGIKTATTYSVVPYFLEGINDDKFGVGKTAKILFYLILKSMVQLMTQGTNPKGWGSLVRQAKESVLNAAESVLQAKVQGFAGKRFQSPDRQPLGYLQSRFWKRHKGYGLPAAAILLPETQFEAEVRIAAYQHPQWIMAQQSWKFASCSII